MSDPNLQNLSPELAALLSAERSRPNPPARASEQVFARLTASIAAGGLGAGASGPGALNGGAPAAGSAAAAGAGGWTLGKAALVALSSFILGGAAGAGAMKSATPAVAIADKGIAVEVYASLPARGSNPWTSAAPAEVKTPETAAPVAAAPSEPEPVRVALAPKVSAPPVVAQPRTLAATPPAAAGSRVEEADEAATAERVVLRRAFSAMSQGRGDSALAALDMHAQLFPEGRLTEQAEALRIQALYATGRSSEAATQLEEFQKRYPNSLLRPAASSPTP